MIDQAVNVKPSEAAHSFYAVVLRTLERIAATQMEAIGRAAGVIADTVERDGIVYAFGSGHSQSVAIELYFRAGGMTCFDVIYDRTFGRAERLPGYAAVLFDSYPVNSRDALIVVSNSGRNPLPVEMALEAKKLGIPVIGITSLAHSASVAPRDPGGARLCEVCDIVIDNCGKPGDASVLLDGTNGASVYVGPTSTLAGAFIAQAIVSAAAEELIRRGLRPPVFLSANLDDADEINRHHHDFVRARLRGL